MALIHGKVGRIQWDTADTDTNLTLGQNWNLDITHDVTDITSMQDTWRTFNSGFCDWTATVTCLLDAAGTKIPLGGDDGMADDECVLQLYAIYDTGDYDGFAGSAICNGESLGVDKDSAPTVTYSFQGAAQLGWFSGAARP